VSRMTCWSGPRNGYVREETLREANTVIVNHHHGLALTQVFGGGTMSSSDGQRLPVRGKSLTSGSMNVFFADAGLSTYTHVSDQHSTFGTKVIVPTTREAHYVLDDFRRVRSARRCDATRAATPRAP
jgi:TnpA family transposase